MSDFYGANPDEMRDLATALDAESMNLNLWRGVLGSRLQSGVWVGPRADSFRRTWTGKHDKLLLEVARFLADAGKSLRENAAEQDQASSAGSAENSGGAGAPPVPDKGVVDSVLGWVGDRADTIAGSTASFGERSMQYWNATYAPYFRGELPRLTETVASGIALDLAGGNLAVAGLSLGMVDLKLGSDGKPYAGKPTSVGGKLPEIDDLAAVMAETRDAYDDGPGQVRVATVVGADGKPRVIVSVPGTETWDPRAGDNPADGIGNFVTAGGGRSTLTEAVELAMANANIPPGAEVMMVGHSQGGMSVADLVSNPDFVSTYNVTNAVTFGSPIDSDQIDPRVKVMELQHSTDLVPRLDTGDVRLAPMPLPMAPLLVPGHPSEPGVNHSVVTLRNPGGFAAVLDNHDQHNYVKSVADSSDPAIGAYEQQLRDSGFLGGVTTSNETIHVGRKD